MIEQLVVKLNEQGKEEATKDAMASGGLVVVVYLVSMPQLEVAGDQRRRDSGRPRTREAKSDAVESLSAEIDQLKELTELDAAMAKAQDLRTKDETEKNAVTIKEAKEAQEAVAQALQVLKESCGGDGEDFYAKASDATALLQTDKPEIFGDEPYTGMGGESGGVIGMMEAPQVIESDFARLEAETTSAEEASKKACPAAEFNEFMEDSKMDKARGQLGQPAPCPGTAAEASKEAAVKQKTSKKSNCDGV
eukprot:Skav220729  [mRNA]  locus=scaffold2753:209093:217260:- [translate_table: standard]